jgi:hypothetical protein
MLNKEVNMNRLVAYCPFEDKECDCFALLADGSCFALQDTDFKKSDGVCRFYKTSDRADPEIVAKISKLNKAIKKRIERLNK